MFVRAHCAPVFINRWKTGFIRKFNKNGLNMKKSFLCLVMLLALSAPVFAEEAGNDAKLIYNQGVEFYKAGEYERSMEAFKKAVALEPNYIDAYYNLGTVLEKLEQYDSALTVFKQIIVRKPDDYEAVYKAALLSSKLGENDNAKSYLSIIPQSAPIAPKAQELANMLQTDMQTIKAQAKAEKASQTKIPQSNDVYNNIPSPTGITTDIQGNIYVAGFSNNTIYKITPQGQKIVYVKDVRVNGPIGMVSDTTGNIYIANYNNNNVLKISAAGEVSVLLSNIQKPYGLHIAGSILYVSSQGSNSVVKYVL